MINWTPEGFIGQLFKTMAPYAPPPPAGATPPPRWGDEQHVRDLFGDRVTDLEMRRQTIVMDHCPDPTAFREYWKRTYGPTIAVYRFNAADPDRVAALDRDFLEFLTTWNRAAEPGRHGLQRRVPARDRTQAVGRRLPVIRRGAGRTRPSPAGAACCR